MAWLKTLAETYDVYSELAGVEKNDQAVLLPISHSTFNAQIEVTVNEEGNFKNARKLEKGKDVVTVIPVTEDSAARSSGIAPHPLCVQPAMDPIPAITASLSPLFRRADSNLS